MGFFGPLVRDKNAVSHGSYNALSFGTKPEVRFGGNKSLSKIAKLRLANTLNTWRPELHKSVVATVPSLANVNFRVFFIYICDTM